MFLRVRVRVCAVHASVKTHLAPACQRQTHPSVHVYDAHVLLSFIFQNDSNLTFFLFVLFLSVRFLFFFHISPPSTTGSACKHDLYLK